MLAAAVTTTAQQQQQQHINQTAITEAPINSKSYQALKQDNTSVLK